LALHLASAGAAWTSLRAALPLIAAGTFPWPAPLADAAADLQRELARRPRGPSDAEELAGAIDRVGERRFLDFAAGVAAYRDHLYRRTLREPPVLWRDGTTRLLDYGFGKSGSGVTLLVIPSLVNRAHVLDLTAETSLLRHLAKLGHRPLLVDWDAPGEAERAFDLTDYIAGRLGHALDAAVAAAGGPVVLLGYCMGGNLALALAQLRGTQVAGLALLATPWDFQADGPIKAPLDEASAASLSAAFAALPELPVDLLQAMFASLDPFLVSRKYRAFAAQQASADGKAKENGALFVALEDWVNDGVPLASKVAAECLVGWYGRNAPARGLWQVAGETIVPERWNKPALLLLPQHDRIVPPASSSALAEAMSQATAIRVASGHVAMIVGRQAAQQTWTPIAEWLAGLSPAPRAKRKSATKTASKRKAPVKTPPRKAAKRATAKPSAKRASSKRAPVKQAVKRAKPKRR
jgi:polyhydroxyalkanoate synthase